MPNWDTDSGHADQMTYVEVLEKIANIEEYFLQNSYSLLVSHALLVSR